MKKTDFLEAIKRNMKKDASEQDMNFFNAIGDALEDAMGKGIVCRAIGRAQKLVGQLGTPDRLIRVQIGMRSQIDRAHICLYWHFRP